MKKKVNAYKSIFLLGFYICIFSFFIVPTIGNAENSTLNFYVTPEFPDSQVEGSDAYFDLNLSPGSKEKLSIKLQNASDKPIKLKITAHTAYTNVHGVVEYGKDALNRDPTLVNSIDDLIEPSDIVELSEKETKTVSVTLKMPKEQFEGLLAGGLRISEIVDEKEEAEPEGEGVAINNEFAYIIGVVVSNTRTSIQPDIDLVDVFADQLNYRNIISASLQNFTSTFINHLEVDATIQKEGSDEILYSANQDQMQMAPNSTFNFPISLEGDRFRSGNYLLKLKAKSGEEKWEWEKSFKITADESRKLNKQDVTVDKRMDWWWILTLCLLFILIRLLIYIYMEKSNKNKILYSKKRKNKKK